MLTVLRGHLQHVAVALENVAEWEVNSQTNTGPKWYSYYIVNYFQYIINHNYWQLIYTVIYISTWLSGRKDSLL
jgi:hypothetical protein